MATDKKISELPLKAAPAPTDEMVIVDNDAAAANKKINAGTLALTTDLTSHTTNTSNPHSVTAAQAGAATAGALSTHIGNTGTAVHGLGTASVAATGDFDAAGAASAAQAAAEATAANASNLSSGTVDGDRLPALSTTKKGGAPATGTPTGLFLKDDGTWAAAGGAFSDASDPIVQNITTKSLAEGNSTATAGVRAHAEGVSTTAAAAGAHAEGQYTSGYGVASHAEGFLTIAGDYAHAEGISTRATGSKSHAEGDTTVAAGQQSHAEGQYTSGYETASHAEGYLTMAGLYAHAEGNQTAATGQASHAEGYETIAPHHSSHAEGYGTVATRLYSHAGGKYSDANLVNAMYAHATGMFNVKGDQQVVEFEMQGITSGATPALASFDAFSLDIPIIAGSAFMMELMAVGSNTTGTQVVGYKNRFVVKLNNNTTPCVVAVGAAPETIDSGTGFSGTINVIANNSGANSVSVQITATGVTGGLYWAIAIRASEVIAP